MDDNGIIELFFERSEKAISELSLKYGKTVLKIAENILRNFEDAKECENETYLGVWNAIPPQKPNSLAAFVYRIARNISVNRYRHDSAQKRNGVYDICFDELRECVSEPDPVGSEYDAGELLGFIENFLDTLDKTNRLIFVRRYWFMDEFSDIAAVCGMNESAVRMRLSRLRGRLKKFLEERGVLV